MRAWPPDRLLYYPQRFEAAESTGDLFSEADELEFRKLDRAGSIAALGHVAASNNPEVRGAALARIGGARSRKKQRQLRLRTAVAAAIR